MHREYRYVTRVTDSLKRRIVLRSSPMYRAPSTLRMLAHGLLCLLLLNLAACSTYQTVDIERAMNQAAPPGVDFGSLVKVTPLQGRTVTFRVTELTPEGLGGGGAFYRYEDMKSLQVDKLGSNDGQALSVVLGILGVAALVALIANADSVRVCSPSPCETPSPAR